MNTKKRLAALLAILICLLSGCGSKKAEEIPATTVPAAAETTQPLEITQPQEATVPELPQDEKMDLLSFADQSPEETTFAEETETIPASSEAVKETVSAPTESAKETMPAPTEAMNETIPAPTETAPEAEIPAVTTANGETIPLISGNEDQLPLG